MTHLVAMALFVIPALYGQGDHTFTYGGSWDYNSILWVTVLLYVQHLMGVSLLMGNSMYVYSTLWGPYSSTCTYYTWVFWNEDIHMLPLRTSHTRRPCRSYQGFGPEDYDHLVSSRPCDAMPTCTQTRVVFRIWGREPQVGWGHSQRDHPFWSRAPKKQLYH